MKTTTKTVHPFITEMFNAGAHIGFSRSRRHPSVRSFLFGTKNNTEIIDLEKTLVQLEEAKAFAKSIGNQKKTLLFIGTKNEGKEIVKDAATAVDMPYVYNRWVGGTFTNFPEIKKRINRLATLRDEREKGLLQKYTKKERLLIDREIEDLESNFGGLADVNELPAAVFVLDARHEHIAVDEARRMNIPVISLSSSDCDINAVTYPVLANDSAVSSISLFTKEIANAYQEGRTAAPAATEQKEEAAA